MIKRTCNANARAFHDGKAGGIDGRKLVEVPVAKVYPRLLQIAQLAGKDFYDAKIIKGLFPREGDIPVGVAIKKCERLDDNRNGSVKLCACSLHQLPLLARLRVERIPRKRKGDPGAAVNENCLALPYHGSS